MPKNQYIYGRVWYMKTHANCYFRGRQNHVFAQLRLISKMISKPNRVGSTSTAKEVETDEKAGCQILVTMPLSSVFHVVLSVSTKPSVNSCSVIIRCRQNVIPKIWNRERIDLYLDGKPLSRSNNSGVPMKP